MKIAYGIVETIISFPISPSTTRNSRWGDTFDAYREEE